MPTRLPTAVLDAKGAFIKDPQRKRPNEPRTDKPLGGPPARLSDDLKRIWKQLQKEAIPGVLMHSDRTAFELLVKLTLKMQNDELSNVAQMNLLRDMCARFAMTPSDRAKVQVSTPPKSSLDRFRKPPASKPLGNVSTNTLQ